MPVLPKALAYAPYYNKHNYGIEQSKYIAEQRKIIKNKSLLLQATQKLSIKFNSLTNFSAQISTRFSFSYNTVAVYICTVHVDVKYVQ